MHAVQVKEFGTSDVLEYLNLEVPSVSTNEVLIKQEAIGVNFIDIYQRSGAYEVKLPFIPATGILAKPAIEIILSIRDGNKKTNS